MKPARRWRWDFVALVFLAVLAVAGHHTGDPSVPQTAADDTSARLAAPSVGLIETLLPPRPHPGGASWVDRHPGTDGNPLDGAVVAAAVVLTLGYAALAYRPDGRPTGRRAHRGGFVRGPPLLPAA